MGPALARPVTGSARPRRTDRVGTLVGCNRRDAPRSNGYSAGATRRVAGRPVGSQAVLMSTTNVVLLLWAASCIVVAYAAGRRWKAPKFWNWVDPIYYPLAIVGIVLLFFSNDSARILADLRYELAGTEQQIADLRAAQPPPSAGQAAAASWAAEQTRLSASRRATEDKIASMQQKTAPDAIFEVIVAFMVSHLWPFVLVLALALKFAKGVAHL